MNDVFYYLVSFGICSFLCVNFHVNYKEYLLHDNITQMIPPVALK